MSTDEDTLSLEALLLSREYLYTLFHKALGGEPCAELFELLSDEQTLAVVDEYADADHRMAELRDFFATLATEVNAEYIEEAQSEYTRVFIGPNRLLALPWESPYVSHEPTLFHKSTLAVRSAYEAHGWKIKRALHLPDDHVSLLCEFMSRLAKESRQAFEEGRLEDLRTQVIEQNRFIAGHLNTWLDEYARGLSLSGEAPLYTRLVKALAVFARLDTVFTVEAIAWVDEKTTESLNKTGRMSKCEEETAVSNGGEKLESHPESEVSPDESDNSSQMFPATERTLVLFRDLKLRHLEDNELCAL